MKILFAEEDFALSESFNKFMRKNGYTSDCVSTGEDALNLLSKAYYDAAIFNLELHGMDGRKALKVLRKNNNRVPILIINAKDTIEDRIKCLRLGADDYLAIPFDLTEIEARVQALIRRSHMTRNSELCYKNIRFDTVNLKLYYHNQPITLPAREMAIFELLLMERKKIVCKAALIKNLGESTNKFTTNTLEVYIYRLRKKLTATGLEIRTIRSIGYCLE